VTPALHQGWTAQWMPELTDAGLRKVILGEVRYAARVEQSLLQATAGQDLSAEELVEDATKVEAIAGTFDEETFLRAGLYWCGPALATSLQPFAVLSGIAPTRARLQMVMAGRDHAAATHVERVVDAAGVIAQGKRCVSAWLQEQPSQIAARVRLRLAPEVSAADPDQIGNQVRAPAVTAALDSQQERSA
jgi:hypothetical protein